MAHFAKPDVGSWTEAYPGLGTGPVSYEDSISREFYEKEQQAVFMRSWLNVGRVEQLPRGGSYFTREFPWAKRSLLIVKDREGTVRAFHNICRHRGNKLVWEDFPGEETSGSCRQFACKYHAWRFDLDGSLAFVQQESEFFDIDKDTLGLLPVACDVWEGFIFVNLAPEPEQTLLEFLGDLVDAEVLVVVVRTAHADHLQPAVADAEEPEDAVSIDAEGRVRLALIVARHRADVIAHADVQRQREAQVRL